MSRGDRQWPSCELGGRERAGSQARGSSLPGERKAAAYLASKEGAVRRVGVILDEEERGTKRKRVSRPSLPAASTRATGVVRVEANAPPLGSSSANRGGECKDVVGGI